MYLGDELPKSGGAVLRGCYHSTFGLCVCFASFYIWSVDKHTAQTGAVELLAGSHHVTIREYSYFMVVPGVSADRTKYYEFELNSEAGHEYKIKKQGPLLTIVDTQSDAVVASTPLR
jgi:hypothetical protein